MPEHGPYVFISYRGGDAAWAPDLVYTALKAEFGEEAVFKAGFNLRAGDEYPPVLEDRAASCPVMLVCIGPRWVAAQNADGTRRLDDSNDWVRREIELALRNGNVVIPLLLGNPDEISIPAPQNLPPDLAPLVNRQAFRLEPGGRLRMTLPDLIAQLVKLVPELGRRSTDTRGGTITAKMQIGNLRGKAAAVRAHEGISHQIDAEMKVDDLAETGDATVVDLLARGHAPAR
ncbi:hypothetical protein ABH926_007201 [Catenulispora sp. GP43]|uniref:toll/interleukin-1 receptor domain-containing protein n=1 Tax=Catenulispora sp. GP43 TaxID=3156263 RepID=UPI0035190BEB